jgi:hypothetical protein
VKAENSCVPSYVFVPDSELDFLTGSHFKLDILVDTQEPFKNSHHKVAFDYDEDTVSLVKEQTFSTLGIYFSNNSNSSAGKASTPLNMNAMRLRLTNLDSTTMGQRSRLLNKNCP